jgi:hypothetical protein
VIWVWQGRCVSCVKLLITQKSPKSPRHSIRRGRVNSSWLQIRQEHQHALDQIIGFEFFSCVNPVYPYAFVTTTSSLTRLCPQSLRFLLRRQILSCFHGLSLPLISSASFRSHFPQPGAIVNPRSVRQNGCNSQEQLSQYRIFTDKSLTPSQSFNRASSHH